MKAYKYNYKQQVQFIAILLFILVFIAGCASTKYIESYQSIVKKVKIDSIDNQFEEQAYEYIQKDIRPTNGFGINVGLYNLFNTKNGKYKTSKIKPLGSPPPILDSTLVEISRNQIEKFLKSKGFFKAKVEAEIKVKHKVAQLRFLAKPGPAFFVNKIDYKIEDTTLKALYFSRKPSFTNLHEEMRYDEDSLVHEREQIYQLMRQNGYFDFNRAYVRFEPDSNQNNSKVSIKLIIDNPLDAKKHQVYTIGETNVVIAPNADGFRDSLKLNPTIFRGIRYTDLSNKFRRNPILRYDFLREGETYDITKEKLTYDRLYELNVFKNVKIDYTKPKDSTLKVEPVIMLIPQKRRNNRIEGEIPFNGSTIGFNVSNTYTDNNFLGGAERFQFQVKGGLQSRIGAGQPLFKDIYQTDFSVSASLTVPRLMVPFGIPLMGKNGMPYTTFSSSYLYASQADIFTRKTIANSITYDWAETKSKAHSFTPVNFEYRFGNVSNLDTNLAATNSYYFKLLGTKLLTSSSKYNYTLNADKLNLKENFVYFRGSIEAAGNVLQGFAKLVGSEVDSTGRNATILGVPFAQFVRPDIDVRLYRNLGENKQLVMRLNAGIGFAYGNSSDMPFEKLFFAGGSSGVRAWQARTLGPGNYNRATLGSATDRRKLFGIDQLGQMRIEANVEYRNLLIRRFFGGKLNGAAFVDFGNIWNISKESSQTGGNFDFSNLGKQIAIGTGLGFRYDVDFFVFRFDIGLKIKDPQFIGQEQWVIGKYLRGGKDFKADYKLKHSPDAYRFVQYNFGIGLPF